MLPLLNLRTLFFFLMWVAIMWFLEFYFLNAELVVYNMGIPFYTTEIIFSTLNSLLFWIFLALSFYKLEYFSVRKSWVWFIGSIAWIIVSGCPACSITLASYIGLAWIISALPYMWLELKVLAFFLLSFAVWQVSSNLKTCSIKK